MEYICNICLDLKYCYRTCSTCNIKMCSSCWFNCSGNRINEIMVKCPMCRQLSLLFNPVSSYHQEIGILCNKPYLVNYKKEYKQECKKEYINDIKEYILDTINYKCHEDFYILINNNYKLLYIDIDICKIVYEHVIYLIRNNIFKIIEWFNLFGIRDDTKNINCDPTYSTMFWKWVNINC